MKKVLLFLALAGALLAASPAITDTLKRVQFYPETGKIVAEFESSALVNGQTLVVPGPWSQVSWQAGANKTVTVGERTYTYAEVSAAVLAIVAQEKSAQ